MRNANGTGSIYKLSGKRRKPYAVVVTTSCSNDTQKRKHLGTFRTRKEAQAFLADFLKDPYDLTGITFKEVYDLWLASKTLTDSSLPSYDKAIRRCEPIWDKPIAELRTQHLKMLITEANVKAYPAKMMRQVMSQVFEYALRNELVQKNYAKLLDTVNMGDVQKPGCPFTAEEEQLLWDNLNEITAYILIGIYSGWRSNELLHLTIADGLMMGGSKTKNGKDRIVPVHSKIEKLVANYSEWQNTYSYFSRCFRNQMDKLGLVHTPKDTRHTFATRCAEAGVDERVRKILMGHSTQDVTEKHYTHRSLEFLKNELEKI